MELSARQNRWPLRVRRTVHILTYLLVLSLALASMAGSGSSINSVPGMSATTLALAVAAAIVHRHLAWGVALALLSGVTQLVWVASFSPLAAFFFIYVFHALGRSENARIRRWGLWGAILASVVPSVVTVAALWWDAHLNLSDWAIRSVMFLIASSAITLGGWTAGFLGWQSRYAEHAKFTAQLAQIEAQRLEAENAAALHRERIATEMHDVVAHSFAVVAAQADGARYALHSQPQLAEQALENIGEVARCAITDLRRILRELRYVESTGGSVTAQELTALFDRLRASGMTLDVAIAGTHPGSTPTAVTVHRIIGEALTNALKYGDLNIPVRLTLVWPQGPGQTPDVVVRNRIGAVEASEVADMSSGHGIMGMRQRAGAVGQMLTAQRQDNDWVVHLHGTASGAVTA